MLKKLHRPALSTASYDAMEISSTFEPHQGLHASNLNESEVKLINKNLNTLSHTHRIFDYEW